MSRRSACIRATIAGCSPRWKSFAIWATRCWWSSTIAKWFERADQLLDFGPGAGEFGGQIVARGTPAQVAKIKGLGHRAVSLGQKGDPRADQSTHDCSSSRRSASCANRKRAAKSNGTRSRWQSRFDATDMHRAARRRLAGNRRRRHNNLRNVTARIPLGTLTAVTGVSGSGKSSLIEDVLYNSLAHKLHRARVIPAAHDEIRGLKRINKVIRVDQQPLGNSPTSNPATYTGVFDLIRTLFAQLPEAKVRGYQPRRFSFNAPGGRCEACEGNGQKRIEMHFLPDVWVECDVCRGRRYNPETLAVRFHDQSIADVLDMPCGRAVKLFEDIPKIRRILQTLCDVGLDYLTLGQPAPTLSGGEAQRVKLAAELARPDTGQTLFLLDEPTTGLHFDDLAKLLGRAQSAGRSGKHGRRDRAQSRRDQNGRLGHRHGARGGRRGRIRGGCRHARADRAHAGQWRGARRQADDAEIARQRCVLHRRSAGAGAGGRAACGAPCRTISPPPRLPTTGDFDINEIGRTAKMPWEADGRRWHTHDCISRNGQPCRWDGQILARVVDRIHELGQFSPTDWNNRSVVEISAREKIRRLVFPRDHAGAMAAEAEIPRRSQARSTATIWSTGSGSSR